MTISLPRVFLAAGALLIALVLQGTVLARLPLPGGQPNLVLVLVVAIALLSGASVGMAFGFSAGLVSDLVSDHPAGVLALCFLIVGFGVGLVNSHSERSLLFPLGVTAVAAFISYLGYAALLELLNHPVDLQQLPGTVLYDVLLAPFVVPVVGAVARRLAIVLR